VTARASYEQQGSSRTFKHNKLEGVGASWTNTRYDGPYGHRDAVEIGRGDTMKRRCPRKVKRRRSSEGKEGLEQGRIPTECGIEMTGDKGHREGQSLAVARQTVTTMKINCTSYEKRSVFGNGLNNVNKGSDGKRQNPANRRKVKRGCYHCQNISAQLTP
jgi:hypothetical protein